MSRIWHAPAKRTRTGGWTVLVARGKLGSFRLPHARCVAGVDSTWMGREHGQGIGRAGLFLADMAIGLC